MVTRSLLYLSIALPVLSQLCSYVLLKHGLSECDDSGYRTAAYYWENCTEPVPSLVTHLSCGIECPAGFYLDADLEKKESMCTECPENTFSQGGATYFFPGQWRTFADAFNSRCFLDYGRRVDIEKDCPRWEVGEDERHLVTGTGVDDVWYESSLEGNFHLVKAGKLSLKYRKISVWLPSTPTGIFSVLIRGDIDLINRTDWNMTSEWQELNEPLLPGDYNIEVKYRFLYIADANTRAEIDFLMVAGTALADFSCIDCDEKFVSHPGAESCYQCPENMFFELTAKSCYGCAPNLYSPAGSVDAKSCLPRSKCTSRDYTVGFSVCRQGKRVQSYHWVEPKICDDMGTVQLPGEEEVGCELCLPGYYHQKVNDEESQCLACPTGQFNTEIGFSEKCQVCGAGFFAAKMLNYTIWSPFPTEMGNECRTRRGGRCAFNTGWVPSLFTITTGTLHESGIELILTLFVNIVHHPATVSFAYTLESGSNSNRLEFYINNRLTKAYKSDLPLKQSGEIPLKLGLQKLTWVYYHAEPGTDIAYIHYIAVTGSDEGGAESCLPCSAGFTSTKESTHCLPCPPGKSAVPGSAECSLCPENEFSSVEGGTCSPCPENTVSNEDRTACRFPLLITFGEREIPVWELARASKASALCSSVQAKLFCKGTFYGPIVSPSGNLYYLSVLNPEKLELVDHVSIDSLPYGYAYGLLNRSEVNFYLGTSTNSLNCVQSDDQVLVNLGSRVEVITYDTNVVISYKTGAICGDHGKTYSSSVSLECDSKEIDGWPAVLNETDCHIAFYWRTRYICPICSKTQMITTASACSAGRKEVTLSEPQECILQELNRVFSMDCNEVLEILGLWQTYAALGVIILVFLVTVLLVVCYCKTHRDYTRLVEVKMTRPNA